VDLAELVLRWCVNEQRHVGGRSKANIARWSRSLSLALSGLAVLAGSAHADPYLDTEWSIQPIELRQPYDLQFIRNRVSGYCVGVEGYDTSSLVQAWTEAYDCVSKDPADKGHDVQWRIVHLTDERDRGYVQIRNRVTDLCLGVGNPDDPVSTRIEVSECASTCTDPRFDAHWVLAPVGAEAEVSDRVHIINRVTGLCLGVHGGDHHGRASQLQLSRCSSN
jgi:hypothetical protein